jgi:hypothetical protein
MHTCIHGDAAEVEVVGDFEPNLMCVEEAEVEVDGGS